MKISCSVVWNIHRILNKNNIFVLLHRSWSHTTYYSEISFFPDEFSLQKRKYSKKYVLNIQEILFWISFVKKNVNPDINGNFSETNTRKMDFAVLVISP